MKKLLSIILAVLMIAATIPFALAADDDLGYTYDEATNTYTVYTHNGLTTAMTNGGKIILGDNIEYTGTETDRPFVVSGSTQVVLELNGKTLSVVNGHGLVVNTGGTLTINDNVGSGKIAASFCAVACEDGGTLVINGGNYSGEFYGLWIQGSSANATINNGTIDNSGANGGLLTVNGGTIESFGCNPGTTVVITGGIVNANYPNSLGACLQGDITITGGTFNFDPSATGRNNIKMNTTTHSVTNNGNSTWTVSCIHTGGTQTCKGYQCEVCGNYFGEADPDAHDWSNLDGVCANGCGVTCAHENYTDGICDNCEYACPHSYGEGVLTRPIRFPTTDWDDGYYTYTCSICGHYYHEAVKRADYSAYDAIVEKVNGYLRDATLTNEAKQEIYSTFTNFGQDNENISSGLLRGDLIESEQTIVDEVVAEMQEIIDSVEEKIASGEYVKVNGLEEIVKINDKFNEELAEKYGEDALADIAEKVDEKYGEQFDELYEKAEALTGSVAENEEVLKEIEEAMKAIFAEVEKCLNGTHSYKYEVTTPAACEANAIETGICAVCGATDEREVEGSALAHVFDKFVSNGDATCEADGTKTAECVYGCGATDTVTDEGSMIDHADEDGDSLCDGCGKELICKDCGRPVHEETGIPQYICLIITLIRLVVSFINAVK